jgi:hypothetical protein
MGGADVGDDATVRREVTDPVVHVRRFDDGEVGAFAGLERSAN